MRDKLGRFVKGHKHSEKTRKKISIGHKGISPSEGIKKKISKTLIGYKHSEITKRKMSVALKGKRSRGWKGGKIKDGCGYILIYMPNHPFATQTGYIRESRLIVEKFIKRHLHPEERVHHRNEIRDDNRPKNLMAFVNDSAHMRFHKNPNSVKLSEIIFDGRT